MNVSDVEAPTEDSTIENPRTITESDVPGSNQTPTPISITNHAEDNSELVTVASRYPKHTHKPPNRLIEQC